jgi:hypothetical protein
MWQEKAKTKALPNLAVGWAGAKSGLPVSDKVRAVT